MQRATKRQRAEAINKMPIIWGAAARVFGGWSRRMCRCQILAASVLRLSAMMLIALYSSLEMSLYLCYVMRCYVVYVIIIMILAKYFARAIFFFKMHASRNEYARNGVRK